MDVLVRWKHEVRAFWTPRWRRNVLIGCTALALGGYSAYRVYNSSYVTRKCRQMQTVLNALSNIAEAAEEGSGCSKLICADLHAFLLSDDDDVPQSLRQLLKLGRSDDVRAALMSITAALSQGVLTTALQYGNNMNGRKRGASDVDSNAADVFRRCVDGVGDTVSQLQRIRELHFIESQRVAGQLKPVDVLEFPRDDIRDANLANDEGIAWESKRLPSRVNGASGSERLDERMPERLLGKLFSPAGTGFASAVVASATRNLVLSILEYNQKARIRPRQPAPHLTPNCRFDSSPDSTSDGEDAELDGTWSPVVHSILDFACSSKGRPLIAECIETFVTTAVTAYLDKTKDVNMYEDLVAGMTRPEHRGAVKDIFTSVCSTAVQTLVRTSHEVFSVGSSGPSESDPSPSDSDREIVDENSLPNTRRRISKMQTQTCLPRLSKVKIAEISDDSTASTSGRLDAVKTKSRLDRYFSSSETTNLQKHHVPVARQGFSKTTSSWVDGLSKTLAVPSNRKLVVEVAGTVSAEAVRSFVDGMIGLCRSLLSGNSGSTRGSTEQPLSCEVGGPRRDLITQFEQHAGRMGRIAAARALVVMTACLAICLHCMVGITR